MELTIDALHTVFFVPMHYWGVVLIALATLSFVLPRSPPGAEATVTLRIVTPDTREVFLDLTSAASEGKGMTVTSVTSAGRDIPVEHHANRLRLPLPAPGPRLVLRRVADAQRRTARVRRVALRRGKQADRRHRAADAGRRALHFPIGIGVSATAGAMPAIYPLDVKDREATLRIPADTAPAAVVLDPGVWLLAEFGTFTKTGP